MLLRLVWPTCWNVALLMVLWLVPLLPPACAVSSPCYQFHTRTKLKSLYSNTHTHTHTAFHTQSHVHINEEQQLYRVTPSARRDTLTQQATQWRNQSVNVRWQNWQMHTKRSVNALLALACMCEVHIHPPLVPWDHVWERRAALKKEDRKKGREVSPAV